jgi:vancomycin resistance protein VanJ
MRRHPISPLLSWSIFNAVFLLFLGLSEAWIGELTSLTALLLYLPQHPFGLLSALLVAVSLIKRDRRMLAFNAVVGVAFLFFFLGFHLPLWAARSGGKTVRVMTWNVEKFRGTPEAIAKVIRAQNPDIVCMQETLAGESRDKTPELLRLFPGWQFRRAREVTTMSRFPITGSRDYVMPHRRKLLSTTWQTPHGPLRVLNAHIATTAAGQRERHENGLRDRAINVATSVRGTAITRASHLPLIDGALNDSQTPVVLAGDFNNPPRGRFYRHLKSQLRDAFSEAGWGLGLTFPSKLPLLHIDYIWLGEGLQAARCFNPTTRASDHLPVVADIVYGSS